MDSLFAEVQSLVAAAKQDAVRREEEERAAHVAAVRAAQGRLLSTLLDGFEGLVRAAAAEGLHEVDLLSFEGADTFDGEFCFLYLLKGPRQAEEGVEPLLPNLRRALAPFRLRHVWRQGTVQNRLVVSWGA